MEGSAAQKSSTIFWSTSMPRTDIAGRGSSSANQAVEGYLMSNTNSSAIGTGDDIEPATDRLTDVYNWLTSKGITSYPCKPRSKSTIGELSTAALYGKRDGDSFFIPTPERLQRIEQYWALRDLKALTPNDVSLSIQCAAGYNNGCRVLLTDADDSQLASVLMESDVLAACPVVKGSKGCKLITFIDAHEATLDSPQWFSTLTNLCNPASAMAY